MKTTLTPKSTSFLADLRPSSIVDRKKFDAFYDLLAQVNMLLGDGKYISRNVVHPVFLVINQLHIQCNYATDEKLDAINREFGLLLFKILDNGFFNKSSLSY